MQLYKLTNSKGNTKNNTHWEVGITHSLEIKRNPRLCSEDVLHAYTSPLLATLMNPAHASYINPLCFTVDGEIAISDGTKVGCFSLTVTDTFVLPKVSTTQRTAFGILCALEVCKDKDFALWALRWLSDEDRTVEAAKTATNDTATYAAYAAAAYAATAYAATTYAATTYAAYAATYAATYAAENNIKIDFQKLAEKAMEY